MPLYRKYRPQQLEEVVGQEHVKRALKNAIETNRISHAYLFTGPRGTGKTSTARIFAKSLNCVEGPTIHPCGKCANCIDITNSTPMDVVEIDAASNRSVEDAEKIIERVMYAPVNSRYKIYIIDEVHMLSTTAFNALLKTLEEPPKNVIFILATTEVHKVLDTIKSRCQRYDFKRITTDDIKNHLKMIADKEGINITDEALITIAKNSAGGMRDSISLLEQLSVLGVKITTKEIDNLLGRISFDILREFSDKIINSLPNEAIEVLNNVYDSGNEPVLIMTNLLDYFRNLLVVKTCPKDTAIELSQLNDEQVEILSNQTKTLETHQILALINKTSEYIKELKLTSNPKLWLEVGVIDLANLTENTALAKLQERITALESGIKPSVDIQSAKIQVSQIQKPKSMPKLQPEREAKPQETVTQKETTAEEIPVMPTISPESSGNDIGSLWAQLLSLTKQPTNSLLKQWANPVEISDEKIIIGIKNQVFLSPFETGAKREALVSAIKSLYGKDVPLTVRLSKPDDKAVYPRQSIEKTKPLPKPELTVQKADKKEPLQEDNSLGEIMEIESENEAEDENLKNIEYTGQSDLVKMTLQVFNGKIIE